MKIVSTGYTITPAYHDPLKWLNRISFYTGILEELAKTHTVHSIEQISYSGKLERRGVLYHFLRYRNSGSYFPFRLNGYIKKLKPDIIFINGFIFPLQTIQLRWALGSRSKIAVINHAERPSTGKRKFLQRFADRYIDLYFFTSKETGLEWVQQGIIANESKIAEAMEASSFFHVMDKQKALAKTGVAGNPVFLFVGRLDANKDPLTILKAFTAFIHEQPGARLYMIYHTEELLVEMIQFLEKETVLQRAVKLVGMVPHDEMQYWYSCADFIISASHYEGSGVAVCEAMSCGCVPVLTNIGSFRMMTSNGHCGFLYEPGDAEALAKIMIQVQNMDMEKEKAKVLQQFKQQLSFEAIARKMHEAITLLNLK